MSSPVLEGWFAGHAQQTHLLGSRCESCDTVYFPRLQAAFCRNPDCTGESFATVPLSRSGSLWSYTDACYAPPPPFVAQDPHQPFAIAAVELAAEQMVVLGPVIEGVAAEDLHIGQQMDLVTEPLNDGRLCFKWRPLLEVAE